MSIGARQEAGPGVGQGVGQDAKSGAGLGLARPSAGIAVDLRLYGILDIGVLGGDAPALAALAAEAVAGGATLLQYRDKDLTDARAALARIRAIHAAVNGRAPLLVNDRVDLALAAGVEGVHLGQSDLHPEEARRLLGPRAIIGLTVKTGAQADELYRLPIDYACIGGVFATASKDNPDPPVGLDGLQRIVFRARLARGQALPLGAIAGIDASNAASVVRAGADGVALIGALFKGGATEAKARDLRARVDEALGQRGNAGMR